MRALNDANLALAGIATVQMKLPDLAPEALAKLAGDASLAKYNPDQPRDEAGRWTGGGESEDETPKPIRVAQNTRGGGSASDAGSGVGGARQTPPSGQAVAVRLRGLGKLTYLDSTFAPRVAMFDRLAQEGGVVLQYTSGYRDQATQDKLKTDPTATTPAEFSLHSAGLAVDIANLYKIPQPHGTPEKSKMEQWEAWSNDKKKVILDAARQAGLRWGGVFRGPKGPDPFHFDYGSLGNHKQLIDNFAESVSALEAGKQKD